MIGFNKGDLQSYVVIQPESINDTNIYRIDGTYYYNIIVVILMIFIEWTCGDFFLVQIQSNSPTF